MSPFAIPYYNPKTGRFASEDPIGFGASDPNLNRYVGNNATGAIDPSGLITGQLTAQPLEGGGSNVVDANGQPTGNVDAVGSSVAGAFFGEIGTGLLNVGRGFVEPFAAIGDIPIGLAEAGYNMMCVDASEGYVDFWTLSHSAVGAAARMQDGESYGSVAWSGTWRAPVNTFSFGIYGTAEGAYRYSQTGDPADWQRGAGSQALIAAGIKYNAIAARSQCRSGTSQPRGGGGTVLRDGYGATPVEMSASRGGVAGNRVGQAAARTSLLEVAMDRQGHFDCWRCGARGTSAADFHLGHRNVPTSQGGTVAPQNIALECAACNLSAGNRGLPSSGMSGYVRGPGAPYGNRTILAPRSVPARGSTVYPELPFPFGPLHGNLDNDR